uniref:C-C motif chemokine 3-like n=1 Tax=Odobenus rosmarus divergens TaxID=9708 RepID=UPI00063BF95B|nr:PREDICTED: C-C motif chemokine 3-like [Odobenus rosmarus divergens]
MRGLVAAIFALLCTMTLCSYAQDKVYTTSPCCFAYTSLQIPHNLVVAYLKTSGQFPKHGVSFVTKQGQYFCANPSSAWVQEYIRDLERIQVVQKEPIRVGVNSPASCYFPYTHQRIPQDFVADSYETDSRCSKLNDV